MMVNEILQYEEMIEMDKAFHVEAISPGMRARLDLKHRSTPKEQQHLDNIKSMTNSKRTQNTSLPFTTKTRAYGTYLR